MENESPFKYLVAVLIFIVVLVWICLKLDLRKTETTSVIEVSKLEICKIIVQKDSTCNCLKDIQNGN